MITAASAWIDLYVNRSLSLQQHTETHDGTGGLRLCLAQTPIVSVDSISLDSIAIEGDRFRTDRFGVVLKSGSFARGFGNVEVTYKAGYAAVPPEIEQTCIDIVAHNYRRRERIGHVSKSMQGETVTFTVSDVPPECKSVLQQYRRVVPL